MYPHSTQSNPLLVLPTPAGAVRRCGPFGPPACARDEKLNRYPADTSGGSRGSRVAVFKNRKRMTDTERQETEGRHWTMTRLGFSQ